MEGENYWHRGLGFAAVVRNLAVLVNQSIDDLRTARWAKYESIGAFVE